MKAKCPRTVAAYAVALVVATLGLPAAAQDAQGGGGETELAKKLANPIASLISVPFQYNYDRRMALDEDGSRNVLNIQPVWPISISPDLNVISRTILPLIDQEDIPFAGEDERGVGDVVQSLFFSPVQPTSGGIIWGAGPVFLIPLPTDEQLSSEKWGLGPTGVALKQEGPWTYGMLANHIWSVSGDDDRADISATYMQPFLAYTTHTATTFTLNTETTLDWENDEWLVPVNLMVSQLLRLGNQPVSIGAGVRYWFDAPSSGPEGFGFRLVFTLLFPK